MNDSNRYYDPFSIINKAVEADNDISRGSAHQSKKSCKRAYLIRPDNKEKIVINKNSFKIGKNAAVCDYAIKGNNAVSRVHAEILFKNNKVFIVDKNSTNKTFLNGIVLTPEQEKIVSAGDEIKIANIIFRFADE